MRPRRQRIKLPSSLGAAPAALRPPVRPPLQLWPWTWLWLWLWPLPPGPGSSGVHRVLAPLNMPRVFPPLAP